MLKTAETLYVGELGIDTTTRNLVSLYDLPAPTFINCQAYRALLWTGVKTGNAPIQYSVYGGDQNGWQWIHTGAIATDANQWFRVAIKIPRRTAWVRIEVAGTTQRLMSKIVGIKG